MLWNADRYADADGQVAGVILVGVDVTGRRRAEDDLRRAHGELLSAHRRVAQERGKLVQAEKLSSIGLLAAGVAHEINNPLAGVMACVESLRRGRLTPLRTTEYFDAVQDGLTRIRTTVGGLLDYSRQRPASPESLSLPDVVHACVRLASPALRKGCVEIVEDCPATAPRAQADRDQVMQAVMNVLLNAMHAVEGHGAVRISLPFDEAQNRVGVRVADDGPGIPADILDRVCDPFFSTKPEGAGTGLGLAVTLGIAEANGGELEIESPAGQGAVVTLWLPVSAG